MGLRRSHRLRRSTTDASLGALAFLGYLVWLEEDILIDDCVEINTEYGLFCRIEYE